MSETPKFGEWRRGIWASEDNPTRDGMFVRAGRIPHGRMNAGLWWEFTDGSGNFWRYPPESVARIEDADTDEKIEALRAAEWARRFPGRESWNSTSGVEMSTMYDHDGYQIKVGDRVKQVGRRDEDAGTVVGIYLKLVEVRWDHRVPQAKQPWTRAAPQLLVVIK